jgi:hypothetical protein
MPGWSDAAAFCPQTRCVRLVSGQIVRLTNLIDVDGDETDFVDQAVSGVGPLADGQWVAVRLDAAPKEKIDLS